MEVSEDDLLSAVSADQQGVITVQQPVSQQEEPTIIEAPVGTNIAQVGDSALVPSIPRECTENKRVHSKLHKLFA